MRIDAMIFAALLTLAVGCLPPAAAADAEPVARSLPVNANIRAEPSLNAERLLTLERGRQVWVHGEPNEHGWVRVSNADKTVHGWMAAYLLDEPANIATPGRKSTFAEALDEPAPAASSGGTSLFARSLGGGSGGGGGSPPPAAGGSLFAQASQSGEIERAQDEKRRREAEQARRLAEEQERQRLAAEERRRQQEWEEAEERRRWEQEEEERRLQEEWEWELAAQEAEASRLQVLNTIQGIEQFFQGEIQQRQNRLDEIQRQQAEERRLYQERERRRQELAYRQQQDQARFERERQERERQERERALREQQARALADLQRATRPAVPSYSPPPSASRSSPSSGGANLATRNPREGCWGMPDPPNTTCVASSARRSGDRFVVTHENICSKRIVASMCNERAGRDATCGQTGILPGRSYNWDSGADSTGAFSVRWVGSKNSVEDWACVSQIGWRD